MGADPISDQTYVSLGLFLDSSPPTSLPSFPGLLDNTVAGGIPSGIPIFETLLKECMEEASIEADVIKEHARAVGAISYFYRCELCCSHKCKLKSGL